MTQARYKLDGISVIRTVATLAIMLYHIGFGHYYLNQLHFAMGVHLFFCISAFLIMYTTETKTASGFLKRRLIRILPLYMLLTVLTFIASKFVSGFGQDNIGVSELVKSLLFIPYSRSGLKSDVTVRPIVGPAWTLYYDVWFALAFFVAMKIKHQYRGIIAAVICIALCVLGVLLPEELPLATLLRTGFLLSFVAGIAVFYVWRRFLRNKPAPLPLVWGTFAGVLLVCLYLAPQKVLLQSILAALILVCVLMATHQKTMPAIFTYFSNLSFSFYLLHYYVILVVGKVIDFTVLNGKTVMGIAVVFAVTLFAAFCSYVVIEKKLGNMLNQL